MNFIINKIPKSWTETVVSNYEDLATKINLEQKSPVYKNPPLAVNIAAMNKDKLAYSSIKNW